MSTRLTSILFIIDQLTVKKNVCNASLAYYGNTWQNIYLNICSSHVSKSPTKCTNKWSYVWRSYYVASANTFVLVYDKYIGLEPADADYENQDIKKKTYYFASSAIRNIGFRITLYSFIFFYFLKHFIS